MYGIQNIRNIVHSHVSSEHIRKNRHFPCNDKIFRRFDISCYIRNVENILDYTASELKKIHNFTQIVMNICQLI
jgi:hypothetical protein